MSFDHVLGQPTAVATLQHALRTGRVHHAYRFEGPDGVGKERLALALARALVCTGGAPLGCERCDACRRAATLSDEPPCVPLHPDITLLERGLYAPETIGRARAETNELSVDQVRRLVLARTSFAPYDGRARVYVIRRADELSIAAANALLKTLEEPRARVHFVLCTCRPDRLLDTIRSRTLPVRFGPLPDDVVRGILDARGVTPERRDQAVELAAGSASAALDLCDDAVSAARERFVAGVRAAVQAPDLGAAVAFAEAQDKDRSELLRDLAALRVALARAARADLSRDPARAAVSARRYDAVARAAQRIERNAAPTLALVTLVADLKVA